jgi:hypothetical protein
MILRRRSTGTSVRKRASSIALFGAVLILAAQFLAVAHFHQGNPNRQINAQTQVAANDGLCALCILAFHAPVNPAASPAIERPHAEVRPVDTAIAQPHVSVSYSSCRTRAPPTAVA